MTTYKWIPTKKRLPKVLKGEKHRAVLFNVPEDEASVCAGTFYRSKRWKSLQGQWYRNSEVSHWMLKPEAP